MNPCLLSLQGRKKLFRIRSPLLLTRLFDVSSWIVFLISSCLLRLLFQLTFLMRKHSSEGTRLPKLVLSSSSKKALKEVHDWLAVKREQGKATFAFPPSKLLKMRYSFYATGEVPSLGFLPPPKGTSPVWWIQLIERPFLRPR